MARVAGVPFSSVPSCVWCFPADYDEELAFLTEVYTEDWSQTYKEKEEERF